MGELEKLIDKFEYSVVKYAQSAVEAYTTHYYSKVNAENKQAFEAKQSLLNYIEQNYEKK